MGTSIFQKYPPHHTFEGRKVLNVGCGFAQFTAPNVVNLDAWGDAQVIWDLGNPAPLPFPDETFDLIIANHILEHVPNWWHCFEELSRTTKVGGMIEVWVPGMGSDSILGYRDHINTINHCSWWGTHEFYRNANNAWAEENAAGPASQMSMTKMVPRLDLETHKWLRRCPKFIKAWSAIHLRNVLKEIGFFFTKVPKQPEMPKFDWRVVEALI